MAGSAKTTTAKKTTAGTMKAAGVGSEKALNKAMKTPTGDAGRNPVTAAEKAVRPAGGGSGEGKLSPAKAAPPISAKRAKAVTNGTAGVAAK